jgi:hypothetical protein
LSNSLAYALPDGRKTRLLHSQTVYEFVLDGVGTEDDGRDNPAASLAAVGTVEPARVIVLGYRQRSCLQTSGAAVSTLGGATSKSNPRIQRRP